MEEKKIMNQDILDQQTFKGMRGANLIQVETVQKFLAYNSIWYVFRQWFKIWLILKVGVPGKLT